jgi:hypothetical protein
MTFGDEEKDDMTFDAELRALIEKAREDGVAQKDLERVVAAFCRRHGREIKENLS